MSTPAQQAAPDLSSLVERLPNVMLRDADRLGRRLEGVRGLRDPGRREHTLARIAGDLDRAEVRLAERRLAVPAITYPDLPVSGRREEIAAAIRDHQVVVVAGETGSGKTTQLPKICLELGRGVRGTIGHTQPRRIAARTVAERIAEELGTSIGQTVGYKVRFTDASSDNTLVKLMTDGILLAEIQGDRMLRGYDTILIDEAHERSLNIDFLLGYLTELLPRRPDLKVVVTSATIDPQRFSAHFGGAPIVEVSGRTYPVEVRYRPVGRTGDDDEDADLRDLDDDGERSAAPAAKPDLRKGSATLEVGAGEARDQVEAIGDAVLELVAEGPGDILVFLSGEREIRDAAEALQRLELRDTEILPLYARLSAAEQHRVFRPHRGRRVVLATNVAETSLTVPGIRYVVDPGTARISRYSNRTKVQRLPIERISQASANQRAGRCGRTSDGICIRLYSQEDFSSRPEFTDPEILRTNLASVILQMTALGLGDIGRFRFVDPPDRRSISDGVDLLVELGALHPRESDPRKRLTDVGRRLAALPVDPRLARMVIEADRNGCVREVMVIAAALSIQDVRERPADTQQAADEQHRRFADPTSDFLAYLNLWSYLKEQQKALSGNAFRRMCRSEHLNYLRVREWQDLVAQLRQLARSVDISLNTSPADPKNVHLSLLAGLLSHIGLKDVATGRRGEYLGARGARFAVFPGSSLFRQQPGWVMAAELVETSRLWARTVARIEPEWVEPLAEHLVKRTYSEPHWEARRGAVMAVERQTLYGVPIVVDRKITYGRIDPELSRDLFIRHALVEGDWRTHHAFFAANRELLADVEDLEHRVRRRDILVDDETLFAFYDERIPAEVVSARHFDAWWKAERRRRPDLLTFTPELLVCDEGARVSEQDYPRDWREGDVTVPLTYQFEPGSAADGVTAHVPVTALNQLSAQRFAWQIPGLREELVTELIRSLPKNLRRLLVPAPDTARSVVQRLGDDRPPEQALADALAVELGRVAGTPVLPGDFDWSRVPAHLRVTFAVEDDEGRVLATGKDLTALRTRLAPQLTTTLSRAAAGIERTGLRTFPAGPVPETFEQAPGPNGVRAVGFPALVDEGGTVALRVLGSRAEAQAAMRAGTRRLLLLAVPPPAKQVLGRLDNTTRLALASAPHAGSVALFEDCAAAAVDAIVAEHGGPARDAAGFDRLERAVRAGLAARLESVVRTVATILQVHAQVQKTLRSTGSLALVAALADVREQLGRLVRPGFVTEVGADRLGDVLRYVRAAAARLAKLPERPDRDRALMQRVQTVQGWLDDVRAKVPPGHPVPDALRDISWMVEELRVSLWAQELGTAYPVSEQRIERALDAAGL